MDHRKRKIVEKRERGGGEGRKESEGQEGIENGEARKKVGN